MDVIRLRHFRRNLRRFAGRGRIFLQRAHGVRSWRKYCVVSCAETAFCSAPFGSEVMDFPDRGEKLVGSIGGVRTVCNRIRCASASAAVGVRGTSKSLSHEFDRNSDARTARGRDAIVHGNDVSQRFLQASPTGCARLRRGVRSHDGVRAAGTNPAYWLFLGQTVTRP
jgi:hypothetical protein